MSKRKRRRRWGFRLIVVLLIILIAGVALAPKIAAPIAKGKIESAISDSIPGSITIDTLSASWFGSQSIRSAVVRDPQGDAVATLNARAGVSLFDLLLGSRDLGEITITGEAIARQNADGGIGLIQAFAEPDSPPSRRSSSRGGSSAVSGGSASKPSVPDSLKARITIDRVRLTYDNSSLTLADVPLGQVGIANLDGTISIAPGTPVVAALTGSVTRTTNGAANALGSLTLNGKLDNLIATDGTIDAESATVGGSLELASLSATHLADIGEAIGVDLRALLGPNASATLTTTGPLDAPQANLRLASNAINGHADARLLDRRLLLGESSFVARGEMLVGAMKPITDALDARGITIERAPTITLAADGLAFDLDAPAPLRPVTGTASATVIGADASLRPAATNPPQPGPDTIGVSVPELTATLQIDESTPEVTTLRVRGSARTTDRDTDTQITADLTADRLLTGDTSDGGSVTLPMIDGELRVTGMSTALLDALVPLDQIVWREDLGPTTEITLRAQRLEEASDLRVAVAGENTSVTLAGTLTPAGFTSGTNGVTLTINSATGLLTRSLPEERVSFQQGARVTARIDHVAVDFDRLIAGDLRGVAGELHADMSETAGRITDLEGESQPIRLLPSSLRVDARNLASRMRVVASSSAIIADTPAGTLEIDVRSSSPLTAAGGISDTPPETIEGTAAAEDFPVVLLQPVFDAAGLDASAVFGPSLSLSADAARDETSGDTTIDLTARSENFTGTADVVLDQSAITASDIDLALQDSRQTLSALLNGRDDLAILDGGSVRVRSRRLTVPRADAGFQIIGAEGEIAVEADPITLRARDGEPVRIDLRSASASLRPGSDPSLELRAQATQAGTPASIEADFTLAGLGGPEGSPIRPAGRLEATSLPSDAAAPFLPGPNAAELATALRETLGRTFGITINIEPINDSSSLVRFDATSDRGSEVVSRFETDFSRVQRPNATGTLIATPTAVDAIASAFSELGDALPRLADTATLTFNIRPDGDEAILGIGSKNISLDRLVVARETPDTPAAALDPVNADVAVELRVPSAAIDAFIAGDETTPHAVTGSATLASTDRRGGLAADLAMTFRTGLRGTRVVDELRFDIDRAEIGTRWAESALADAEQRPLSGAIGPKLSAAGAWRSTPGASTSELEVTLNADRLTMSAPASVSLTPALVTLREPTRLNLRLPAEWASRMLARSGRKGATPRVTTPLDLALRLDRFIWPLAPESKIDADLAVDADITAPRLALETPEGEQLAYSGLRAAVSTPRARSLKLDIDVRDEAGDTRAITIDATADDLLDDTGRVSFAHANSNIDAEINGFPIAIADAVLDAKGRLVGVVGPVANVTMIARDFPREGGTFNANATSPQATLALDTFVRDGVIFNRGPATLELREISERFGFNVGRLIPVFGDVSKSADVHAPATITLNTLEWPVEGDFRTGVLAVAIDPGEIDFAFSPGLQSLLKAAGQRGSGQAGKRLQPFLVTLEEGVAEYTDLRIPLGEFTFRSFASFDLDTRREDITMAVPAGALASEAFNIRGVGGAILNDAVVLPIRRRGAMDQKNEWKIDFDAAEGELFSPEKLLEEGIRRGLRELFGGG